MDALILGLRVVVALGAVLGLMWFLQRRLGKGTGRRRADRALTIVSRQSLGQKASVVVVDAAGQRFLLGVTEHAVNVLHTGDIPPEPEEVPVPGISRSFGDFARILAEASPLAGNHFSSQAAGRDGDDGAPTTRTTPPTARTASGTCRRPAAAPCTGTPTPAAPPAVAARRRCGPPAAARVHPGRLHMEAGCRRSQERTPQLIRLPLAPPAPPARVQLAHEPLRLLALGLAAVLFAVLLLWLNATAGHAAPIDPVAPVAPTDPANPGQRERQHPDQRGGR